MHKVCIQKIEEINLMADSMLSVEKQEILKKHILECPACEAYYGDITALKSAVSYLDVDAPDNLNQLIKNAVRKSSKKNKTIKFIYRYGTVAAACLVLVVFFAMRGNFNFGSDKFLESAEMQPSENSTYGNRGGESDGNYSLAADDSAALEKSEAVPESMVGLLPEEADIENTLTMDALTDYKYTTSAVDTTDTIVINAEGLPLDSGYGGMQDVFYASSIYSVSELMAVIEKEFRPDRLLIETDNLFFYISLDMLPKLEARLGLVASGVVEKGKKNVSVRIISIKPNDD